MKPIKVRTVLFTFLCPLSCRYCDQKNETQYGVKNEGTREWVFDQIEKYDKEDDPNKVITRLVLTGGEPFLFSSLIKEIVSKYGDRFQYEFNTSGYSLTKEDIEFLSNYPVRYNLSVDGGERLTNYLRPVKQNKYGVGYHKKLQEILPTLLYHAPETPFKTIINPLYLDLLHKQYLEAEQMGFRDFFFTIDFNCLENRDNFIGPWTNKYTNILIEEVYKMVDEIVAGFAHNIRRPRLRQVDEALSFLLKEERFDPDKIPCQLFNGRTVQSTIGTDQHCLAAHKESLEEIKKDVWQDYLERSGKCLKDPACAAFEFCAHKSCLQTALGEDGKFFHFREVDCAENKTAFLGALRLLKQANSLAKNSKTYLMYLKDIGGEKIGSISE